MSFLRTGTPFQMDMGGAGIEDVALVDLDVPKDGHPEVIALRSDAVVAVRKGTADPMLPFSTTLLESSALLEVGGMLMGRGERAFSVEDLDGDFSEDVVVASPQTNGVVIMLGDLDAVGTFPDLRSPSTGSGSAPQDVVARSVDANSDVEIVTANADGTVSVMKTPLEPNPDLDRADAFGGPTPGALLTTGRYCPGAGFTTAVAVAFAGRIRVLCVANDGKIEGVDGPSPSAGETDFLWPPGVAQGEVADIFGWRDQLYALLHPGGANHIVQLSFPDDSAMPDETFIVTLGQPLVYSELVVHADTAVASIWWDRMAMVGPSGVEFAR